ncbi:MAG: ABC transporter permease, partial [Clostridia bacterium]|nr:ABC transporter permease [Clostridia bacterium]
ILTPTQVFREQIEDRLDSIVRNLITMLVILIMMSLCMYFIMRSSLMNRIKEVGIYRAIGVSKRNLIFRFLVEAALLTTLSVFLGYLFASGFLYAILQASSLVKEIFYYPLWMAGIVLILLYGISLFFGVLPILSLLKKTPSEILAKYDI